MATHDASESQRTPTLFDPLPPRAIPVKTVQQPTWEPGTESDEATERPAAAGKLRDEGRGARPRRRARSKGSIGVPPVRTAICPAKASSCLNSRDRYLSDVEETTEAMRSHE